MKHIFTLFFSCISIFTLAQNKIGIGTNTPSDNLQVIGAIRSDTIKTNSIRITPNAGVGKVFTSDALGNGSWQSLISGSNIKTYNGLTKSNDTINLGGRLFNATQIGLFNNTLKFGDMTTTPSLLLSSLASGSSQAMSASAITQTFTSTNNFKVDEIHLDLTMLAGSNCTVNLYDNNNNLLGTTTQLFGALTNGLITFIISADIENGKVYTISITGSTNGFVNYSNLNPYGNGSSNIGVSTDIVFEILGKAELPLLILTDSKIGIGTLTSPAAKLDINGNIRITDGTEGAGKILTSDASGYASWQTPTAPPAEIDPQVGLLNNNYVPRWTNSSTSLVNSVIQDNGTSISMGLTTPSTIYQAFVYRMQLVANGDGQTTLMGYRTRDSQNDGISYAQISANDATRGYNFWGDVYTFGVGGWNYNDYSRCGGTFGADVNGLAWGSLGYRSSGLLNYGVYGNSAYASGGGYLPTTDASGIGGGFFGVIGSLSKGSVIGQLNEGELFAVYNKGDVYTSGKNVELVTTNDKVVPSYAVTSAELTVYNKGKITLVNGEATVTFNENYANLLGEEPVVTASPMGACNGVYIASVTKNGFTLKEQNNGTSNVEIAWIAVGNRIDAEQSTIPNMLTKIEFNRNLSKALFADGDRKHSGIGMWWNGTELQFGDMPASLNLTREQKTKMLEDEKAQIQEMPNSAE